MSDLLPYRENTTAGEIDRQICELCEASGADAEVTLRIILLVTDLLQDSIARALGTIGLAPVNFPTAHRPTPPTLPPPPPPIDPPAPIAVPAVPAVVRPFMPAAVGPARTPPPSRYYCIAVGRRVGVFAGPWYVTILFFMHV